MDILERLTKLMDERHWTTYKLAKEADLSHSTVANLFQRNTIPTLDTLEHICKAFGLTLSQFLAEGNLVELDEEQASFFKAWAGLSKEEKEVLNQFVKILKKDQ